MFSKIVIFLKTDIWRIRLRSLPRKKSFFLKQLRIIVLALKGFAEDKCQLIASALTYYSLLSIVPVAAMAFGVAKGFGFEKMLERQILDKLPGQTEVLTQVIDFSNKLLDNTKGGLIAGIGVAILFWTVIKVLTSIEKAFNSIWGVRELRSLGRRFSDYLSIMFICPVLVIVASSVTVFITSQITAITGKIVLLGSFSGIIFFALKLLPYCVIWILFSFVYIFMPNTKVDFKSGIFAGIIAGTLYQFIQWAYIYFQIGAAKYNAIYGSFAALPLFLVWLQLSWLVVLLGAEISFAHQNVDTYEFEPDCLRVSPAFKRLLSLRVTHLLVKKFSKGEKPLSDREISQILDIPVRLTRNILFELVEAGIISEVKAQEYKDIAYQPARQVCDLSIKEIIDHLDRIGTDDIPIAKTKELNELMSCFQGFSEIIEKSSHNKLLKEI